MIKKKSIASLLFEFANGVDIFRLRVEEAAREMAKIKKEADSRAK